MICTAFVVTSMAVSAAKHFAIAASLVNTTPSSRIAQARYTSRRAASIFMAISATISWIISKEAMGWPNCFRSFAYATATSSAAWARPTETAPTNGRAESSVCMAIRKPWPSRPTRLLSGMTTLSRISSQVLEGRMPILSSLRPTLKPGVPFGTMKAVRPRMPPSLRVLAKIR